MTPARRLRQAWAPVVSGIVLRIALALAVGVVPASWAGEATRAFPRGELALVEHGGMLLFDVFAHGSQPYGSGRLWLFLGVFAITLGLIPFGATVLALHRRDRLAALFAGSLARLGTSLLLSGVTLFSLGLVVLVEVMAFGPLITTLGRRSLVGPLVLLALAMPIPALTALYGDALRVRGLLCADGFMARFGATLRNLRGRLAASFVRYLLAAIAQTLAVLGAAVLGAAVVARPTGLFLLGTLGSLALLAMAAFARAWLLGHLVSLIEPSETDVPDPPESVEALHGSHDVGYEAAPSRDAPR